MYLIKLFNFYDITHSLVDYQQKVYIFFHLQLLSDKTPVSGPVAFKTRNSRKRKGKVAEPTGDEEMESLENEYRSEKKTLSYYWHIFWDTHCLKFRRKCHKAY